MLVVMEFDSRSAYSRWTRFQISMRFNNSRRQVRAQPSITVFASGIRTPVGTTAGLHRLCAVTRPGDGPPAA
jgi:hypothetical protein